MVTGERQQRYRERQRQAGMQRVEVWLETSDLARLEALRQPGERLAALVMRALKALSDVSGDRPGPGATTPWDWRTQVTGLMADRPSPTSAAHTIAECTLAILERLPPGVAEDMRARAKQVKLELHDLVQALLVTAWQSTLRAYARYVVGNKSGSSARVAADRPGRRHLVPDWRDAVSCGPTGGRDREKEGGSDDPSNQQAR